MLRYVNRLSVLLARVAEYRNDLVALLGFRHELYRHGCQSPASSLSRQRPATAPERLDVVTNAIPAIMLGRAGDR